MRSIIAILREKGYSITLDHDLPTWQEYENLALHITVIGECQQYITGDGHIVTKSKNTPIKPSWKKQGDNLRCKLFHFTGAVPADQLPEGYLLCNGFQLCMDIHQKANNERYTRFEFHNLMKRLREDLYNWTCHVSMCMVKINGAINETIYETG